MLSANLKTFKQETMIKVYFDWNVISQMKNGKHSELREIVFENDKLFKPFSTSHIGDLLSSYKETEEQTILINSDLEFISQLTGNTCLFNNGSEIVLDYYTPKDLFEERIEEKDLFKDISLDGLGKIFAQNDLTKGLGEMLINLLKSISLEEPFKQAFENPESAKQMEQMFPGLKDNLTMEEFFKSFNEMNIGLNEDDKYKGLRKIVQSGIGINRDKIFDNSDPFQIIDKEYKKIGVSANEYIDNTKNAPKWFNEISNEYILLDMHGYQEDKVNVEKGRKETFKNTTEDAFHAAFASTCNFYVINDNKSYKKTKKIYEKLFINTLVLKPDEFVSHYTNYLDIKDENLNFTFPFELIKNGKYVVSEMDGGTLRTYYFPYFLFDFFNKLLVLLPDDNENPIILLSQNGPTNHKIYSMEIKKLVTKISNLFGDDIENLREVKDEEFKEEQWIGRKWLFNEINFRLIRNNGHFQLYFDL